VSVNVCVHIQKHMCVMHGKFRRWEEERRSHCPNLTAISLMCY